MATQTAMFLLTDRWVALGVVLALILVPFWCPLALEKTVQSVQVSVFSSFGPFLNGDPFQDNFLALLPIPYAKIALIWLS